MWAWIVGVFKGLFGAKGTTQIGKGNQNVTATTAGANSPVVTAGRDVHFNAPVSGGGDDAEMFRELEKTMPDLLSDLRRLLAETPLTRIIIIMDKHSQTANWPDPHFRFNEDQEPGARGKIAILENYGLLRCIKERYAYRITEKLAKHVMNG